MLRESVAQVGLVLNDPKLWYRFEYRSHFRQNCRLFSLNPKHSNLISNSISLSLRDLNLAEICIIVGS